MRIISSRLPTRREPLDPTVVLSATHVSKSYDPQGPMRLRRAFARLGGLQVQELTDLGMEDDDDDLADDDDDHEHPIQHRPGPRVIDDMSIQLPGGITTALVGPQGAGKTVLLKMIAGLVPPTEGRILVRGRVLPALKAVARGLPSKGHTLKSAIPFIIAVIGLPFSEASAKLDEIAEFMQFPQLKSSPTGALDNKRKAEIVLATMLVLDPEVLLLDIPIPQSDFGERCLERLERIRAGGGLVVAESRDLRRIPFQPDRVIALEHGRLTANEEERTNGHRRDDT